MGSVIQILISPQPHGQMQVKDHIKVIPKQGIVGDRYFYPDKKYTEAKFKRAPREITLIESEAFINCSLEHKVDLQPEMLRRNLVTQSISLNTLVGEVFKVGNVRLKGLELCQPCQHISDMNKMPLIHWMLNKAGLRAEILDEGIIHRGDSIQ